MINISQNNYEWSSTLYVLCFILENVTCPLGPTMLMSWNSEIKNLHNTMFSTKHELSDYDATDTNNNVSFDEYNH